MQSLLLGLWITTLQKICLMYPIHIQWKTRYGTNRVYDNLLIFLCFTYSFPSGVSSSSPSPSSSCASAYSALTSTLFKRTLALPASPSPSPSLMFIPSSVALLIVFDLNSLSDAPLLSCYYICHYWKISDLRYIPFVQLETVLLYKWLTEIRWEENRDSVQDIFIIQLTDRVFGSSTSVRPTRKYWGGKGIQNYSERYAGINDV